MSQITILKKFSTLNQQFETAENIQVHGLGNRAAPRKRELAVDEQYKVLGDAIGVCPHELQHLLTKGISVENEIVINLLKKIVTALKLTELGALEEIKAKLKKCEDDYQREYTQWERDRQMFETSEQNKAEAIRIANQNIEEAWSDTIDELYKKLKVEKRLDKLDDEDRWLIKSLMDQDGRIARISNGKVIFSPSRSKTLNREQIINIVKTMPDYQAAEHRERLFDKLTRYSNSKLICMIEHPDRIPDREGDASMATQVLLERVYQIEDQEDPLVLYVHELLTGQRKKYRTYY